MFDEVKYEGDIPRRWGNLSAEELVFRFWEGTIAGTYVGHGETYLHPSDVLRDGKSDASARELLLDPSRALTTLPGDTYELVYVLPDSAAPYDLFLESRGYYLEWIRNEWIAEENGSLLTELFLDPHAGLQRIAPAFKRAEPGMERVFWGSRYAKP